MKKVQRVLANYSADLFGTCSALYELGGLIVMHDASGCNSTYNTHDEPRWYDIDSMIYVSGLTEYDAILGNDERIIGDILEAAGEAHPKFIAVCGGPMPFMLGTDYHAIARIVERKCGIPSFGFQTDGMHTYVRGAGQAFAAVAERFCANGRPENAPSRKKAANRISVNLLGVTPLDFSVVGNTEALRRLLEEAGFEIRTCWAMGDTLENLASAGGADVSAAVSVTGLPAAEVLKRKFGVPYVTGLPVGKKASEKFIRELRAAGGMARSGASSDTAASSGTGLTEFPHPADAAGFFSAAGAAEKENAFDATIIGEPVFASSLRTCLEEDFGLKRVRIVCPVEEDAGLLRTGDVRTGEEEDFDRILNDGTGMVIADPIYRRVLRNGQVRFIDFPHEAYSGRLYRKGIPVFIGEGFNEWLEPRLLLR